MGPGCRKPIAICFILVKLCLITQLHGQTAISGVVNAYTPVTAVDYCNSRLTVVDTTGFTPGQMALLIQMKGADVNTTNTPSFGSITAYHTAGNYELVEIQQRVNNEIVLANSLLNSYDVQKLVQLVAVPVYRHAVIVDTLKAKPWDGLTGGVLAVICTDTLTMNAPVNVAGMGFRGGLRYQTAWNCQWFLPQTNYYYSLQDDRAARKGEGIAMYDPAYECGKGAYANGGGGGNDHNAGGGGGSNAGAGGIGGQKLSPSPFYCNGEHPGIGGYPLDYQNQQGKIFMGGGGGAGHDNDVNGTSGGNGGGIVVLSAPVITGNGWQINAAGESALRSGGDGAGGGGAGGTVLLFTDTVVSPLYVIVKGGNGGNTNNAGSNQLCHGPGGGGGGGVVWFKSAQPPPMVQVDISGGNAGITTNNNANPACLNSTNGAMPGDSGAVLFHLSLPQSHVPSNQIAFAGSDTAICKGDSVVLTAGPADSVVWTPSSGLSCFTCPAPVASPDTTTTYVLFAYNAGCQGSDSLTVFVLPRPLADAGEDTSMCTGDTIRLSATGGQSYYWSPATGLSCIQCPKPFAFPVASVSYTVKVDNGICDDTDTVFIRIDSGIVLNALFTDTAICAGDSVHLFVSGGVDYSWTPRLQIDDPFKPDPVVYPDETREYHVISGNGCGFDTLIITVTVKPRPSLFISDTVSICKGDSVEVYAISGGSIRWLPAMGLSCTQCDTTIAFPDDSITYTIIADSGGCITTGNVHILVNEPLVPEVSVSNDSICVGDTLHFSLTGNIPESFAWMIYPDGDTFLNTAGWMMPDTHTVIRLSWQNAGCTGDTTLMIYSGQKPDVQIPGDTTICEGDTVAVYVSTDGAVEWSPGFGISCTGCVTPSFYPENTTIYTITSMNGRCLAVDSLTIHVLEKPTIDITPDDIETEQGDSIIITIAGAGYYTWQPATWGFQANSSSLWVKPDSSGWFYIYGYSSGDTSGICVVKDSVFIHIIDASPLALPTAFTPNQDGVNDYFRLFNKKGYTLEFIKIFNRWGKLIYQSSDIDFRWDGKYQGKPVELGVYTYVLKAVNTTSGEIVRLSGNVTVLY